MSLYTPTAPLRSVPDPRAARAPRAATRPTFEPTAGGVELAGRTPRVASTAHGWFAVVLGLPFAAMGVGTIALALGQGMIARGGKITVPPFAVAALGLCFVLAGLSFVVHGVRGVLRRRGLSALRARYPEQPWMVDFPWDSHGGRDEAPGEVGRLLGFVAFITVFLIPFHWVAFFSSERPVAFQLVTLLFDAVSLGMLGRAAYLVARRMRYGESRIGVGSFPIAPGTTAELLLDRVSAVARAHAMRATLRCIEERYEVRGHGKNRSRVSVCYELYRDEALVAPGEPCVRFELPERAPTTHLAALPPRYWELELAAETPGVDYGARFLVPVY